MIEFRAFIPPFGDAVELYAKLLLDGKTAKVVTCEGMRVDDPPSDHIWPRFMSLPFDNSSAQSLFDALWAAGLRPNKGEASAAHVEALKYHLEDMRSLVFKPGDRWEANAKA